MVLGCNHRLHSFTFPSPYGVSFILIGIEVTLKDFDKKFPSPYGVSFILMFLNTTCKALEKFISFRLLTEYHSFLFVQYFLLIYHHKLGVSVSLRSIIHSYIDGNFKKYKNYLIRFPSPYGVSFILMFLNTTCKALEKFISFRLLTEYHSFLFKY